MSTAAKPYEHLVLPLHTLETHEWFAVQTRSRHEKKVEMELQYKGLETFLPMLSKTRQWSDRTVKVDFPLFSGYVFVCMQWNAANHLRVLKTNGVVSLLGTGGRPTAIPEWQIESTRRLIATDTRFDSHTFLKVGQRVRILSGSLEGVEGVLLSVNGEQKLVVSIDLIRQSLAVSLKGYEVEAIGA